MLLKSPLVEENFGASSVKIGPCVLEKCTTFSIYYKLEVTENFFTSKTLQFGFYWTDLEATKTILLRTPWQI